MDSMSTSLVVFSVARTTMKFRLSKNNILTDQYLSFTCSLLRSKKYTSGPEVEELESFAKRRRRGSGDTRGRWGAMPKRAVKS
jgi:hypothetical protein